LKELWCDFDGVIVPNVISGINISGISRDEFTKLVINAYQDNPIISESIKVLISENKKVGSKIYIITGRKELDFRDMTEKVLEENNIEVDHIYYYPEESNYEAAEYYEWKARVIGASAKSDPSTAIRVIDDDQGLLEYLKENILSNNLVLTHYEFFMDRNETQSIPTLFFRHKLN